MSVWDRRPHCSQVQRVVQCGNSCATSAVEITPGEVKGVALARYCTRNTGFDDFAISKKGKRRPWVTNINAFWLVKSGGSRHSTNGKVGRWTFVY